MSEREWSAELADPEAIRAVLGTPPPPLTGYPLESVLIDEHEASVTLWFSVFAIPAGAADLWHARGHNAEEYEIRAQSPVGHRRSRAH
ncbi:hypothetical protein AB0940_18710 [Streptomyces sp. NPDC006656]|uniref:hypothetical protein n=1 Tax=Streptomyces sp. NPDC006656 TaxID=3156899 RepID=UPI003452C887